MNQSPVSPSPAGERVGSYAFHALLCLMSAGCNLGPLEVAGLRCEDARPCGEGLVCFESRCVREVPDAGDVDSGVPDAGIPRAVNLLVNPGFEQLMTDGGVTGWRATNGRIVAAPGGRSGIRSGRLQSTGAQQALVLVPNTDVEGPELGMLFCASLWLRGDTDAGVDVTLAVRDRFFDGGVSTSSGTRITVRADWVQVKEEFATIGTSTIQLRLTTNARFDAGEGMFIDDAWLSRAETTGCPQ